MASSPAGGLLLLAIACLLASPARPFAPPVPAATRVRRLHRDGATAATTAASASAAVPADGPPPPPSLNGKTVMPARVLAGGLRGHTVPAVYAVLSSSYKRG